MENATGRWIASNHKTGTEFSKCLIDLLDGVNIQLKQGSRHASDGFSSEAFQINMVRDPFTLVHSGYNYHRSTKEAERWTLVPFGRMHARRGAWQGALEALTSYQTCPGRAELFPQNLTYRRALNDLNLTNGLLLESLRALHRDIPYMLNSALCCARTDSLSSHGTCANVNLDVVMRDYSMSFKELLARPLRIDKSKVAHLAESVEQRCNPRANSDSAEHQTEHKDRGLAIEIIRDLDVRFLGGALTRAETLLALT